MTNPMPANWPAATREHANQTAALLESQNPITPVLVGDERLINIDPALTDEQLGQQIRQACTDLYASIQTRCEAENRVVDLHDTQLARETSPVRVRLVVKTWPADLDQNAAQ